MERGVSLSVIRNQPYIGNVRFQKDDNLTMSEEIRTEGKEKDRLIKCK